MAARRNLQAYLDKAYIAKEVFQLRPDYRALLVGVSGLSAQPSNNVSETLLSEAEKHAESLLATQAVTDLPHISAWRAAYKAFGAKPNKTRNSLEALTRRAAKTGLPRVNRLTDIYNALSVKHQIPFGGEDLDKYQGAPFLIRATGKETFETNADGQTNTEHPDVGEVVWCDEAGVTCRHWNWRQAPRTALSEQTSSVLFILDALEPCDDQTLEKAVDELVSVLKQDSPEIEVARRLIKKDS